MCQHFLAGGEVLLIFNYLKQTEFFYRNNNLLSTTIFSWQSILIDGNFDVENVEFR